jgi:alpha-galactosidase/6-phospho-beta-glucosidase family protein
MGIKVKILEEQLDKVIYNALSDNIITEENLTRADVEQIAKKTFRAMVSSRDPDFENRVKAIVKDMMKNDKDLEKKVVDVSKNVLVQLYKALWTKRNFWTSDLKNVSS